MSKMNNTCIGAIRLPRSHSTNDFKTNELSQQLFQLKTILANSACNIDGILMKSTDTDHLFTTELMASAHGTKPDHTNIEIVCKEEDGRISLAYELLPAIPRRIADKFAPHTHTLDLSFNDIKDLTFLSNFKILHTLILDNNVSLNEKTLPFLPNVRILWLNKCEIYQLSKWIHLINICTPNIRQLSLMGNPGVRSLFNGGSLLEHNDYMMYVIGSLPKLEYLDDVKINDDQRAMARAHATMYSANGLTPFHLRETFSRKSNVMTMMKHDAESMRRFGKLVPQQNCSKFDRL